MAKSSAMRRAPLLALLLVAVLIGACGNRLSTDEVLADRDIFVDSVLAPAARAADAGGRSTGADAPDRAPIHGAVGAATPSSPTGAAGGGPVVAVERGGPTRDQQAKKPIVIGLIGYFSGIGGSVHLPKKDAFLVWERMVNDRGGIDGHPVKVLWGDDGGDEARAIVLARDFVEAKGAVALSVTGSVESGVVAYAESRSVPVIGIGTGPSDEAKRSPMMFPTSPGGSEITWGSAALAVRAGVRKVGILACAESAACQDTSDEYAASAAEQGLEVVYEGRASVAQPDYTAECLQARNAGAELLFTVIDSAAPVRMATSCGRQDYRPIWQLASPADFQADVPELDGAMAASDAFPWMLRSGPPGVLEYVDAFRRYNPRRLDDGTRDQASAWVAAKVFEAAIADVADEPTSDDVLRGLWSMRNETLGGLASGRLARTYTRDAPAPDTFCVFGVRVERGRWVAPDGLTPLCR